MREGPSFPRMIGLSLWATILTLAALAIGVRAFIATLFTRDIPWWFEPVVLASGLASLALTILALGTVQRRFLPWLLLPAATAFLAATAVLTVSAPGS